MVVYFYSGEANGTQFDGSLELPHAIFNNESYNIVVEGIRTKVSQEAGCDASIVVLTNLSRL